MKSTKDLTDHKEDKEGPAKKKVKKEETKPTRKMSIKDTVTDKARCVYVYVYIYECICMCI
jgi:hypothetical protein